MKKQLQIMFQVNLDLKDDVTDERIESIKKAASGFFSRSEMSFIKSVLADDQVVDYLMFFYATKIKEL